MSSDAKKTKTGRIYQLVNMITNEKYVGATFQTLYKRQYDRKRNYNKWLKGKSQNGDKHKLFDNIHQYGWECFRIELLAEVEVKNRAELHKLEGDYIRKLDTFNNGLNGNIPNRDRKQYHKQRYQNNKDKVLKQQEQYRQNNNSKYICKICNYPTSDKNNYTRHLKTQKHKSNILQKEKH